MISILVIILDAASGAIHKLSSKANDVSTKNGDVSQNEETQEYKGFFIKQKPSGNKNESSTDDGEPESTQKGFYKKPAHVHHRF